MQLTTNLNLKKPEITDNVNIEDLNGNADILDAEVTKLASTTEAGRMSAADKTKLNGVAAGAQVNAVSSVAGKTGAVTLAKADVGLGNVDNVQQAPISHVGSGGLAHAAATISTAGFMSATDKTKLDGIAVGANNYVHPSTHSPSIIAQDANNRFVTDAEKVNWNAKVGAEVAEMAQRALNQQLPTGTDLNTVITSGKYDISLATNKPVGSSDWIYLEVYRHGHHADFAKQVAFDFYVNRQWVRTRTAGAWTLWTEIGQLKGGLWQPDFNTLLTQGSYVVSGAGGVNTPPGFNAGVLEVIDANFGTGNEYYVQRFTDIINGDCHQRPMFIWDESNVWGEWRSMSGGGRVMIPSSEVKYSDVNTYSNVTVGGINHGLVAKAEFASTGSCVVTFEARSPVYYGQQLNLYIYSPEQTYASIGRSINAYGLSNPFTLVNGTSFNSQSYFRSAPEAHRAATIAVHSALPAIWTTIEMNLIVSIPGTHFIALSYGGTGYQVDFRNFQIKFSMSGGL
jgi:hypothetical protein